MAWDDLIGSDTGTALLKAPETFVAVFIARDGTEMLKLHDDGRIFVRGELAENNKAVCDALRDFLVGCGYPV